MTLKSFIVFPFNRFRSLSATPHYRFRYRESLLFVHNLLFLAYIAAITANQ